MCGHLHLGCFVFNEQASAGKVSAMVSTGATVDGQRYHEMSSEHISFQLNAVLYSSPTPLNGDLSHLRITPERKMFKTPVG